MLSNQKFTDLLVGEESELSGYLEEICFEIDINDTKSRIYCHCLKLDGNGRPRVKDLTEFVAKKIIDYSIPKSEIKKAKEHLDSTGSTSKFSELQKKASKLFTSIKNSGEGGEVLLYILAQEFLKVPQLLCKMPLKTNSQLHYNGADGIHMTYEDDKKKLILLWGESKLYSSMKEGIKKSFESIKQFLLDEGGSSTERERDIQLITSNIDILDDELKEELLKYLDKDNPLYSQLEYRGICFVGFDYDKYPATPNTDTLEKVVEELKSKINDWTSVVKDNIDLHENLNTFVIHVFLIPFPSVQAYRDSFLEELGIKTDE